MEDITASEQKAYEHYKKIEAENFHLKIQLKNVHRDNRVLKRVVKKWKEIAEDNRNPKPTYRNRRRYNNYGR